MLYEVITRRGCCPGAETDARPARHHEETPRDLQVQFHLQLYFSSWEENHAKAFSVCNDPSKWKLCRITSYNVCYTKLLRIKGEKYEKSFKRGEVLMSSLILPGLGQTKISGGAPWWLAGVAAYGSLSGGFVFNSKYRDHYDAYLAETDPVERSSLFNQSQSVITSYSIHYTKLYDRVFSWIWKTSELMEKMSGFQKKRFWSLRNSCTGWLKNWAAPINLFMFCSYNFV